MVSRQGKRAGAEVSGEAVRWLGRTPVRPPDDRRAPTVAPVSPCRAMAHRAMGMLLATPESVRRTRSERRPGGHSPNSEQAPSWDRLPRNARRRAGVPHPAIARRAIASDSVSRAGTYGGVSALVPAK